MNIDFRNINSYLIVARWMTPLFMLLVFPIFSYASQLIYTIQVGSFNSAANAQKQFDSIVQGINEKELDNLRIEKIGKFYSVRLGKFENYASAKKYLRVIKPQLPESILLKAYIKNENIIRLYSGSLLIEEQSVEEKSVSDPVPVKTKPQTTGISDNKIEGDILTEVNEHRIKEDSSSSPVSEITRPLAAEKSDKKIEMDISTENIRSTVNDYDPGIHDGTSGYARSNSLGLKISTLGAGLEAERSFSHSISSRIGINYFTYNYVATINNIDYNFDLNLMTVSALVDWRPFKGRFRISGGVMYNDNHLDADAKSATTYNIGNAIYTNFEVGNLTGKIDFNDITPYLGLGWDPSFGKDKRFSLLIDMGVVYQGTPEVNLSADGSNANDPTFQNNLQQEEDDLQSKLDGYEYYPVVGIGCSYRF